MKTLGLQALSTNPGAFALYRKLGFKRAGVIEKKIRRGGKSIDAIMMTRALQDKSSLRNTRSRPSHPIYS